MEQGRSFGFNSDADKYQIDPNTNQFVPAKSKFANDFRLSFEPNQQFVNYLDLARNHLNNTRYNEMLNRKKAAEEWFMSKHPDIELRVGMIGVVMDYDNKRFDLIRTDITNQLPPNTTPLKLKEIGRAHV